MTFNIVGTNPPEGLQGFLYQNAGKLRKVPLPGSEEGENILTKIKNCIKENLNLKTWVSVECESYTEGNTN